MAEHESRGGQAQGADPRSNPVHRQRGKAEEPGQPERADPAVSQGGLLLSRQPRPLADVRRTLAAQTELNTGGAVMPGLLGHPPDWTSPADQQVDVPQQNVEMKIRTEERRKEW